MAKSIISKPSKQTAAAPRLAKPRMPRMPRMPRISDLRMPLPRIGKALRDAEAARRMNATFGSEGTLITATWVIESGFLPTGWVEDDAADSWASVGGLAEGSEAWREQRLLCLGRHVFLEGVISCTVETRCAFGEVSATVGVYAPHLTLAKAAQALGIDASVLQEFQDQVIGLIGLDVDAVLQVHDDLQQREEQLAAWRKSRQA